jgi:hypothetical protein
MTIQINKEKIKKKNQQEERNIKGEKRERNE